MKKITVTKAMAPEKIIGEIDFSLFPGSSSTLYFQVEENENEDGFVWNKDDELEWKS